MRERIRAGLAFASAVMISACAARSAPPSPAPITTPTPASTTPAPTAAATTPPAPAATTPPAPEATTPPAPAAKADAILETRQGLASYYGPGFDGKRTASGIRFDKMAMVAAHPTYPFGTVVRV